jgi:hypothetical protein
MASEAKSTGTVNAQGQTKAIGSKEYELGVDRPVGEESYLPTEGIKPGSTTGY